MAYKKAPLSKVSQTCIGLENPSTLLKLEKGAEVSDYTSVSGTVHLHDWALVEEFTSLSGMIVLAAQVKVSTSCTLRGNITVGARSKIGAATLISGTVSINRDAEIGDGCRILSSNDPNSQITIGPGAVLEPGTTILPGSEIGAGSIVRSGSTLSGSLPPDSTLMADGSIITHLSTKPLMPKNDVMHPKDAPKYKISEISTVSSAIGTAQYSYRLTPEFTQEFLLKNSASDILIVSFHGAVNRDKGSLPRFEWFNSLKETEHSCLFLSDPSLAVNPELRLGWFIGNETLDLHKVLAELITAIKEKVGATKIILLGLSGGGFAALQISSLLSSSTALVFNPRTEIPVILDDGSIWWTFYFYIKNVAPELTPPKARAEYLTVFHSSSIKRRLSARNTYSRTTNNKVLYYTNVDEPYHAEECVPFQTALSEENDVTFTEYRAGQAHTAPSQDLFREALSEACRIAKRL